MSGNNQKNLKLALWSEFTAYSELINKLPELKTRGVALYLAVHEQSYLQPELFDLLKASQELGVEVRPWPLLDKKKGYWPNKWNLHLFREFCLSFLEECHRRSLKIDWLIMDLEPHLEFLLELEDLMRAKNFLKARKLVHHWGRKKALVESQLEMQRFVKELQGMGKKVHAVTMPMVLDDLKLGANKLQHLLGIPIAGIPWDEVSFMVYRPYFWDYLPGMPAHIVKSYAHDAKYFYGSHASLALGPIGSPMVTKSTNYYTSSEDLIQDFSAARSEGVESFSLFCLEGIEEQGGLDKFLGAFSFQEIPWSFRGAVFRKIVRWSISKLL